MRIFLLFSQNNKPDRERMAGFLRYNAMLPDAQAVHVACEIAVGLRFEMRLGVADLPRAECAHVPAALVLDGVQRLGERLLLILIIMQGLQDAVFDILHVESMRVLRAHVAPRPMAGESD